MSYTKTAWVNDSAPAINADNLNKIEQGIYNATETADAAEQASNKVSTFQATPDDTHYPSEKLVKDSLDAKYTKPATGIPKTDLASDAQTILAQFYIDDEGYVCQIEEDD